MPIVVAYLQNTRPLRQTWAKELEKRTRCAHIKLVAVAMWAANAKEDQGSYVGQDTGAGEDTGDGTGGGSAEPTAEKLLKQAPLLLTRDARITA